MSEPRRAHQKAVHVKKCPFCGARPVTPRSTDKRVQCSNVWDCGVEVSADDVLSALRKWNRRAS